jgi:ABC-type amino acid transport substrate-binding protein
MRSRVFVLVAALVLASPVFAQERPLRIGTKVVPPFVMRDESGNWTGISVDLWRELADAAGLSWEFEERTLPELFTGLRDGSLDAAVAALTITTERERTVDFTHPYFQSGLGIAVAARGGNQWLAVLRGFMSPRFLGVLALLLLLLVGSGVLVWILERKRNREQFGGGVAKGLGSGVWWSAVTMTTVGYGDKAPQTIGGRLVALVWMFACVVFLSGLTAMIASALTVSRLEYAVGGPDDLARVRTGTVANTTSEQYLESRRVAYRSFPTAAAALEALAEGTVEAVVYDRPLLRWLVGREYPDRLAVLPAAFRFESYAIAVPDGSPLRERLNILIPELVAGARWAETVTRYLGP